MGSLQSRSDTKSPYNIHVESLKDEDSYVYPGRNISHSRAVTYQAESRYSPAETPVSRSCGLASSPDSSDECILPMQHPTGIVRTTEVQITKS